MEAPPRIRSRWVPAIAAAVVALGVIAISPAFGGPHFLTLTKAKKVFFTKKQANQRFLLKSDAFTQAQADAAFLTPAEGDASYLPRTGTIKLQVTPVEWVATTGDGVVDPAATLSIFSHPSGAGTSSFVAAATLPSTVQGVGASVESFELCYDATDSDATLSEVALTRISNATPAQPQGTLDHPVIDTTDRDDATCRTYSPASPVPVGATDFLDVAVVVQFSSGLGTATVTRLTINLTT